LKKYLKVQNESYLLLYLLVNSSESDWKIIYYLKSLNIIYINNLIIYSKLEVYIPVVAYSSKTKTGAIRVYNRKTGPNIMYLTPNWIYGL